MEDTRKRIIQWKPRTYDTLEIINALLGKSKSKDDIEENSMLPSEYMMQFLMSTQDRTQYLLKPRISANLERVVGDFEKTGFKAIPNIVIFQNFVLGDVYTVTLSLVNISQNLKNLKACCEKDPFFSLEFRGSSYTCMVAPGLAHVYNVTFFPDQRRDYKYQATFVTDNDETLVIPIIAIGPRPILDIPDRVEVPTTAVKIPAIKSLFVRNIGDAAAIFTAFADNEYFRVEPSNGTIDEDDILQFTVTFISNKIGDFQGNLYFRYETGETLRIETRGSAVNCNIRTDRGSIKMEETYLGMSRSKVLTIHNRSDYVVNFQWMYYKDVEEDKERKEKYKKLCEIIYETEKLRHMNLTYYNIIMPDAHAIVCERIYGDEIESLMNETFRYNHMCFEITPMDGEIWPQSSKDVTILFNALEVGEICSTAYLEVTGREDRIPLSLCGVGKGPIFRLNVVTINLEKMYMCSVHHFEIVAANKGYISGTLIYRSKPTDFGGSITVEPSSAVIKAGDYQSFVLIFTSNRKGEFLERVDFVIKESLEVISLHVKGSVICPTLHFDKQCLNFGVTPLGFSTRQEVSLHNLSSVPVSYRITVLNDGNEVPLTREDFTKSYAGFPSNPREFVVQPDEGVVLARNSSKIRITYIANVVRTEQSFLRVDMLQFQSDPIMLPISFSGAIASLSITPKEIIIRFCFINFPYTRTFNVQNNSDIDGYFYLVPQSTLEDTSIYYSMSTHEGFLKARQSKAITLTVITRSLGKHFTTINMLTMGEESPQEACKIMCTGQGPVVTLQPRNLDFGKVPVLQSKTMSLSVISDSPIPAEFQLNLGTKNSPWSVTPSSGELEPNGSINIDVTVHLRDAGVYNDNIVTTVTNSRSIYVQLKVVGTGYSIIFEPSIFPTFDMGLRLSHQRVSIPISIKNLGSKTYQLVWSQTPEVRFVKGQFVPSPITKFQVHPAVVEVPPNSTIVVHCKINWDANETVIEEWYLFGHIQGQGKRELLSTSTFKMTFREPYIIFSKKVLSMRIDMSPCGDKFRQSDELSVTNMSGLNLNVQLSINEPFQLITEMEESLPRMRLTLFDRTSTKIRIYFSPKVDAENRYSKSFRGILLFEYDEHPIKDKVVCKGAVNFPNLEFSTKDITMTCELGSSLENILTIINDGPIPVIYKFIWIEDSIEINFADTIEEVAKKSLMEKALECSESKSLSSWHSESKTVTEEQTTYWHDEEDRRSEYLVPPPMNSPASDEMHAQRANADDDYAKVGLEASQCEKVTLQEMKDFLMGVVDISLKENKELSVLGIIGNKPHCPENINRIFDIVPREGTVPSYSSQNVHFSFHGMKRVQLNATAACEIFRGPVELVNVSASADAIEFSVDTNTVDLGQQLFCEACSGDFNLFNHSLIAFDYTVDTSSFTVSHSIFEKIGGDRFSIDPSTGVVNAKSSVKLTVTYRPIFLGPFDVQFKLKVAHLKPLVMNVTGVGIYPQLYFNLPRKVNFQNYSVELEYRAIQSFAHEFSINKEKVIYSRQNLSTEKDKNVTEAEMNKDAKRLEDKEWQFIPRDEIVPSLVDMEMALERFLASKFIEENLCVVTKHSTAGANEAISEMSPFEYVVNVGCVIIGFTANYSATLTNYGPVTAEIKLNKKEYKETLTNQEITVQFKRINKLIVDETMLLHVIFQPSVAKYSSRITEVEEPIHFEVMHGCTIPVILKGIVTYPYITIDKKMLDFQDVVIGECLMMCLLFKNEGLVECEWESKIWKSRKVQEETPFYLHRESDVCPVAHSSVVKVYFKPRNPVSVTMKLIITVKMGLEKQTITLTGRGIEKKVNISEPIIELTPMIPFVDVEEKIISIENDCGYPMEFFWHHLDRLYVNEDRIAKALTSYYGVQEILLPPRKIGDKIPPLLIEFYENLVYDMARECTAFAKEFECEELKESESDRRVPLSKRRMLSSQRIEGRKTCFRKGRLGRELRRMRPLDSFLSLDTRGEIISSSMVMSSFDLSSEISGLLPNTEPAEIERLLLRYIDNLRKNEHFHEIMKDPVKDLFDVQDLYTNADIGEHRPQRKACIIFHGAPFTEYQEVACRCATVLGIPALHVDTLITEVIAFSDSLTGCKLRETVDEVYQSYTAKFADYWSSLQKESLEMSPSSARRSILTPRKLKSPKSKVSPRSTKAEKSSSFEKHKKQPHNGEQMPVLPPIVIPMYEDPDPLTEFQKIPNAEALQSLDPMTRYEYKIRAIQLLEKIMPPGMFVSDSMKDRVSVKGSEKSSRKAVKHEETFLGMDLDLLLSALKERLSMAEFKRGFVVQTLKNSFVKDENTLLLHFLSCAGYVEYSLFVTFFNSIDVYRSKIEEMEHEREAQIVANRIKRIEEIEEMSLSEYEELPEEERRVYLEAVLPHKKEESLYREALFAQRISEYKREKEPSMTKIVREKKISKSVRTKGKTDSSQEKFKVESSRKESPRKVRSRDTSKTRKEKDPTEIMQVVEAMKEYQSSLAKMEHVLLNWDPVQRTVNHHNKTHRTAKLKDKGTTDNGKEREKAENGFHIWYVKTQNLLDRTMDEIVVAQMEENYLAKRAVAIPPPPEPNLKSKNYSILACKGFSEQQIFQQIYDPYKLFSMVPPEEVKGDSKSMIESIQEYSTRLGNQTKRKKELNKVDDSYSLNICGLESKETMEQFTSNVDFYIEETPKPRWVVLPNEKKRFKVRCEPEQIGIYQKVYTFSMVDHPCTTYHVMINAIVDIPRIDMNPYVLYPKVEENKVDDTNEPAFFLNTATFDFGSLVILRKDKKHQREVVFTLHNVTPIPAEVKLYLHEKNSEGIVIDPHELIILPKEHKNLTVSASATKFGPCLNKLHICVKNNPHVDTIQLRCYGTKLEVDLDGNEISFGRVLLYRKEVRDYKIQNNSNIAIHWVIESEEEVDPQLEFAPRKGVIQPLSEQNVQFTYNANEMSTVSNDMTFKAFLKEDDDEPAMSETISITAETYDVAVDINYANPINMNNVKVDCPSGSCFTIHNRGNYEVKYVILMDIDQKVAAGSSKLPANLKNNLEIRPISGHVLPHKTAAPELIVTPKIEMVLKNAPILKCHLMDAHKDDTIVAEFPINVSMNAYYVRFSLRPFPDINFGSLAVRAQKTMYLDIENIGKFPLKYSIELPLSSTIKNVSLVDTARKDQSIGSDIASRKDKKEKQMKVERTGRYTDTDDKLSVGPFTVMKIEGEIEGGETDSIPIECYPEIVGTQKEDIVVMVPDSSKEDRNGKKVTLIVESRIPYIDFSDLDCIFQDNHIVDHVEDFVCPKEINEHTVFSRQEKRLYFRRVCVSNTHVTCMKLHNRSIVPANVRISCEVTAPQNAKPETFVVEPQKEQILPQSSKRICISFTPSLIQNYHGRLKVHLELPPQLKEETDFIINLTGESCVPEITIVEPIKTIVERVAIKFGRTLVLEQCMKRFAFQNTGLVQAKVIAEIYDNPDTVFTFGPSFEAQRFIRMTDYDATDTLTANDRCIVLYLLPEDIARLEVQFHPKSVGRCTANLRLFVVNNPYENLIVSLEGEGFTEMVVLEDLEILDTKVATIAESASRTRKSTSRNLSASSVTSLPMATLVYKLDYETCYINKMYKKTFKIVNKSQNQYFRFQWATHPNIVFIPSTGHLRYSSYKQVTATLLESEPKRHVDTRLECTISQIKLSNSLDEVSWDDRQTTVRWEKIDISHTGVDGSFSKKIVEPSVEPENTVVPGTKKVIALLLNATIGFSEYSCTANEICFKDTLMFQKREYKFTLSNPGVVNTNYVWILNMSEEYPRRLSESALGSLIRPRISRSKSNLDSRSSGGTLYPTEEGVNDNLQLHRCKPLSAHEPFVDIKPQPCFSNYKPLDLYSSTACLTDRSTDSWLEGEDLPFEIMPEKGTLLPGEGVECTVRFSPLDVFDYKAYLTCKIENLDPKLRELVIPITSRSVLPYCHFEVPESDYLSSGRRASNLPGPIGYSLDSTIFDNIRVIEIKAIGTGGTYIKRFAMINPTTDNFRFSWKDRTFHSGDEVSNFQCLVPEGVAERGKKTQMEFTFLATDVGVFESFWSFSIEKYNLECLFLLVGIVVEPAVYCSTTYLKMKPTVLGTGTRNSVTLINKDDLEIPFRIIEDSLYSEGRFQNLEVTPMKGTLKSNGEQVLWISYNPTLIGEFEFSVQCSMKYIKRPLTIVVTTISYNIVPIVSYKDTKGETIELRQDQDNVVDFDKIVPKKAATMQFEIRNSGNITFYYTWDLGMTPELISRNTYVVSMPQKQGHVTSESPVTCSLTLMAKQKVTIKNHCVLLQISRGPTYRLILKAVARKPLLEFSFHRYDFGPCYIQKKSVSPYRIELRLKNCEDVPFLVECKYQEQPYISMNLDAISKAIASKSTAVIPILFQPLKETLYKETFTFIINSFIEEKVVITGEGIPYKIRLVNPRDKIVELGNPPVRKIVTKRVPVINEGRAPLELQFGLINNLSRYDMRRTATFCSLVDEITKKDQLPASISEAKRSDTMDPSFETVGLNISESLFVEPSEITRLQPREKLDLIIKFKPTYRMKRFVEKVGVQLDLTALPLFVVQGSCVGAEFRLNRSHIAFGTIVRGSISENVLVLMNIGDIGARFTWDTSNLPNDFAISPTSGYSSPGVDINFKVKFEPITENNAIQGQAVVNIEKYVSLKVVITGACCKLPNPTDVLLFETEVRSKQIRTVNITNDSITPWKLKSEISGNYFHVDEIMNVAAEQSAVFSVTYQPFVMNTEHTLHEGSLLLRFPDNRTPVLYILQGRSLPPNAADKIVRQLPAKMKYTELLPVVNWLDKQQQFRCEIKNLENREQGIPTFYFTGNSKIDVPPNSQRDYRAVFHSYKECQYNFKVVFTNEEGEYQFYDIHYTVTKPDIIESIKLTTIVRSPICYNIQLDNPLTNQVLTFTVKCNHPAVTVYDVPKIVLPMSNESITINYYPLITSEEITEKLEIECKELGIFPYELRLKALPPPPEKMVRVTATLGNSINFSLPIRNYTSKATTFIINVDNESFTYPKQIDVGGLEEASLNVVYEPSDIKNITATLIAVSHIAGEFTYPIIASYSLPKPQGPYVITSHMPVTIKFKNVFNEPKKFHFTSDNSKIFKINVSSRELQQKQEVDIIISLNTPETLGDGLSEEYPATGKLLIYSSEPKIAHIVWIYYLRGILE